MSIEAELSESEGCKLTRQIDRESLETAVERRINGGYYRRDFLMDELAADDPISLRAEDFRPRSKRAASSFFD